MSTTRKLVHAALIGAAYAVLTIALAPISYGAIQFRISEILCILPFFMPHTAWGLFVGCAVANLFSASGALDVVFGSLATLLAGLCCAGLGRKYRAGGDKIPGWGRCFLACAMPVVFNTPIIGAVLSWMTMPHDEFLKGLCLFGAQVGAGEAAVMFLCGVPAMRYLPRTGVFKSVMRRD